MRLVLDIESNGLLQDLTKIHCIAVEAVDSSYSELFVGNELILSFIENILNDPSIELIGHNIFCFDLLAIKKVYGIDLHNRKIHDTLVLGQLLFPDLKNDDSNDTHNLGGKIFSKRDTGSHSLRAYGQRIMCYKGEYEGTWEEPNEDMFRYCIQDVKTCKRLFQILESKVEERTWK